MLSLIIPCRNEAGNIAQLFEKIKGFSCRQVIFVEGGSKDNTYEELLNYSHLANDPKILVLRQTGVGKFDAVRLGISYANQDHIAIWDGDMTIDFYDQNKMMLEYVSLTSSQRIFITANRLNGNMENGAMRLINLVGNVGFALITGIVLKARISDALAGTKIFPKDLFKGDLCKDAIRLDPFGDLFIIRRATKTKCKIITFDCEYKARVYGETNIPRWSGGAKMLKFITHIQIHKC
jgi:glycosyltransferase involved in cell wall biosynthesis